MNYRILFLLLSSALASGAELDQKTLPSLDNNYSPLSAKNQTLLSQRLTSAYDQLYSQKSSIEKRNFSSGYSVYFLRQELQSLIDMWRGTGNFKYLDTAHKLVSKAINDAKSNPKPLISKNITHGTWPCFFEKKLVKSTGGHGQLYDFQGSAGFLMVALALKQAGKTGHKEIVDFVEQNILEKWIVQKKINKRQLTGIDSNRYLMMMLESARDKRELFADICIILHKNGRNKYPYYQWAKILTALYISERTSLGQSSLFKEQLQSLDPKDWGILKKNNGYIWYWIVDWRRQTISVEDTSHANRTVWLACSAYSNGLIDRDHLDKFIITLRDVIWKPEKKAFYFTNIIDGSDNQVQGSPAGQKGNVWFGWHRLSAYDAKLKNIFIAMAYDLTKGGVNFPNLSQNTRMENGPLCLIAWGARLNSKKNTAQQFP